MSALSALHGGADPALHGDALVVENLTVEVRRRRSAALAVENVSFSLSAGEVLCLVGESGCGKTLTALSLMGLLPAAARLAGGRVLLGEEDLTKLSEAEMRRRRGTEISMIFQEPMTALDPSFTIGYQLAERFPDINPLEVRFTDLHKMITELPTFVDDPSKSTEGKLEAIQMAWNEEHEDRE